MSPSRMDALPQCAGIDHGALGIFLLSLKNLTITPGVKPSEVVLTEK